MREGRTVPILAVLAGGGRPFVLILYLLILGNYTSKGEFAKVFSQFANSQIANSQIFHHKKERMKHLFKKIPSLYSNRFA
jgi:hypothetical protein